LDKKILGKTHTQTAIVAWVFACWTCAIEMDLADTTNVVVGDIPSPRRHCVPLLDFDLHSSFDRWANMDGVLRVELSREWWPSQDVENGEMGPSFED
jgi:hypothetical protein